MNKPRVITWPRASWPALLALGLASRLLVVSLGMLAPLGSPDEWSAGGWDRSQVRAFADIEAELATALRRPLTPWYRWDAFWYLKIARSGYEFSPDRESSAAFMPLLPLIMAAGSAVGLDIFWVGSIVSNLAFSLGLVAFGRTAARVTGDDGTAWRSCLLLITFPTSFFFSAPYHESLGFGLSAWATWAWIERRPLAAAAFLPLSTASRLACVSTSVAIVAEWFDDLVHRRKPRAWAWPVAAAGAIGLVSFFSYLGVHLGDPFAHLKAHKAWGRKPGLHGLSAFARQFLLACRTWRLFDLTLAAMLVFIGRRWVVNRLPALSLPLSRRSARVASLILPALACAVIFWAFMSPRDTVPFRILKALNHQQDNLAFFLFLGLGVSAWLRRGPFWGCLTLVPIALAASSGSSLSMMRVVLSAFPAFIEAAELCGKRWSFLAAVVVGIAGQIILFGRFARLVFAG